VKEKSPNSSFVAMIVGSSHLSLVYNEPTALAQSAVALNWIDADWKLILGGDGIGPCNRLEWTTI